MLQTEFFSASLGGAREPSEEPVVPKACVAQWGQDPWFQWRCFVRPTCPRWLFVVSLGYFRQIRWSRAPVRRWRTSKRSWLKKIST